MEALYRAQQENDLLTPKLVSCQCAECYSNTRSRGDSDFGWDVPTELQNSLRSRYTNPATRTYCTCTTCLPHKRLDGNPQVNQLHVFTKIDKCTVWVQDLYGSSTLKVDCDDFWYEQAASDGYGLVSDIGIDRYSVFVKGHLRRTHSRCSLAGQISVADPTTRLSSQNRDNGDYR
eukprot:TRINITY_DN3038_c1_g2_i1.p1 TRINITY_DN3038_c1_g2~~TRINITY_DN3038_c1_g2_i1.p1  ORF type:complete len:175 (+),score=18.16 TRINITY_DN3038_c1_g2_i1:1-525(+)